jgi:hypothetical protein
MISSAIVPRLLSLHVSDCLIRLTINDSIAAMAVAISANAPRLTPGEFACQTTPVIL